MCVGLPLVWTAMSVCLPLVWTAMSVCLPLMWTAMSATGGLTAISMFTTVVNGRVHVYHWCKRPCLYVCHWWEGVERHIDHVVVWCFVTCRVDEDRVVCSIHLYLTATSSSHQYHNTWHCLKMSFAGDMDCLIASLFFIMPLFTGGTAAYFGISTWKTYFLVHIFSWLLNLVNFVYNESVYYDCFS